mmetsp:Transcript_6812/g.21530  ORF Transcript_6812/g.21530 Transcript_6812/m.21530 type:complete len:222 (-) Transcript_6812:950-1615(-)
MVGTLWDRALCRDLPPPPPAAAAALLDLGSGMSSAMGSSCPCISVSSEGMTNTGFASFRLSSASAAQRAFSASMSSPSTASSSPCRSHLFAALFLGSARRLQASRCARGDRGGPALAASWGGGGSDCALGFASRSSRSCCSAFVREAAGPPGQAEGPISFSSHSIVSWRASAPRLLGASTSVAPDSAPRDADERPSALAPACVSRGLGRIGKLLLLLLLLP